VPFIACLIGANAMFPDTAWKALLTGLIAGGVVLGSACWLWAVPSATRFGVVDVDRRNNPERVVV
jgi:hypothetical protein